MDLNSISDPVLGKFIHSYNPERIIRIGRFIDGGYQQKAHEEVGRRLFSLNQLSNEKILILFEECAGGGIRSGLNLYRDFSLSKARTFGLVIKRADSSALLALLGCHEKYAYSKETTFLVHEPIPFTVLFKDLLEEPLKLKEYKKKFKEDKNEIYKIHQSCSKRPMREVIALFKKGEKLSAEEALRWHLIDKILNPNAI